MALSTYLTLYLLVDIVVEFIIRGVGEQDSETRSQGEEDLSRCVHPHLCLINSIEIRTEIVHYAHGGAGQRDATDEQGKQDHVREEGSEPDDCEKVNEDEFQLKLPEKAQSSHLFRKCRCPSTGKNNR